MSDVTTKPIDGLESDPLAVWMSDLREDVVTDFSESEVAKMTAGASSAIAVGALGGIWAIVSGWSLTAKILGTMGAVALVAGAGAATGTLPDGIQSAIADGAAQIGIQLPNPSETGTTPTTADGDGTDEPTDVTPGGDAPVVVVPGVDDIIDDVVAPIVPDVDVDLGIDLDDLGVDLGVGVDDLDIEVDGSVGVPGAGVGADVNANVDLPGLGDDDPGDIDVSVDATVPVLPDVDLDVEVTVPTLPLPDVEIPILPIDSAPTVTLPDIGGLLFP